jgi:hypothetical protein
MVWSPVFVLLFRFENGTTLGLTIEFVTLENRPFRQLPRHLKEVEWNAGPIVSLFF